jgi:CRISPR system Cascade subunit CasD
VQILTFLLHAPLAACGDQAMSNRRGTWLRPGRSAVMGLVAGALGIDRKDEQAHTELHRDYGLALRVEQCGPLLRDFHTAQMPARKKGVHYATRREELRAVGDNDPVVTERFYIQELTCVVALWPRGLARWTLEEIAEAMLTPRWAPYLGRLCCALALPLDPQIVEAVDPAVALADRTEHDRGLALLGLQVAENPVVTLDAADAREFGLPYRRVEMRRDALISRQRWQFGLREEAIL